MLDNFNPEFKIVSGFVLGVVFFTEIMSHSPNEPHIPHESHNPWLPFSNMVVAGTTSSSASSASISGDTLIL